MKTSRIVLFLVLFTYVAHSQIVTETVTFDNYVSPSDNDFVNFFSVGTGLNMLTTNGITGGCLETPLTVNWGNDNAVYCSKYIAVPLNHSTTKLSFKYDSAQVNSANFDRAVSLFLRPSADFNHYIIASVTHDKRLQIVSYSYANTPPLLNLLDNHWYELSLTTVYVSNAPTYQINVSASVNDLGISGQSSPVNVAVSNGTLYDSLFVGDSAVQVSFTAALWGGAKYVDNFHYEGLKSADSCAVSPTGIGENIISPVQVFPNPVTELLTVKTNSSVISEFRIYDLLSRCVLRRTITGTEQFDIESLPAGLYLWELERNDRVIQKGKVIKE
jgi:hypothetical protein